MSAIVVVDVDLRAKSGGESSGGSSVDRSPSVAGSVDDGTAGTETGRPDEDPARRER